MNYHVRNYIQSDIEVIGIIDSFLELSIRYNGDYKGENIFCVVDDNETILGVGCLNLDSTWYVIDEIDTLHKMNYAISISEDVDTPVVLKDMLMNRLIDRIKELKVKYPSKSICICAYCEDKDFTDMEYLLHKGFLMNAVTPVMKYDLTKDIPHFEIPSDVIIEEYHFADKAAMDNYHRADKEASAGIPDSEAQLWFRTGAPEFKNYSALYGDELVGSITTWLIKDNHSSTENIFVVPDWRRKNIAKELISTTLCDLKQNGKTIATLCTKGTNKDAIKLYLSYGYTLYYNLIELHYSL